MTYENRDGNHSNFRNDFKDDGKIQLFIAKGRNHGMDENSLLEFIVAETGVNANTIARIKLFDDFSFFAVTSEDAEMILDLFQKKAGENGRPLVSKAKRKKPNGDRNSGGFRGERRDFNGGNRFERNDRGGNRDRRDFRNRDGNN